MNLLVSVVLLLPCLNCAPVAPIAPILGLLQGTHEEQLRGVQMYLDKYGYPHGSNSTEENNLQDKDLEDGLKVFQEIEKIPMTGKADENTIKTMEISRCGNRDLVKTRNKRFVVTRYYWRKLDITYKIMSQLYVYGGNFSKAISQAFKKWSDVTPLTFTEVTDVQSGADIEIQVKEIDGYGGVLAQALYPTSGGDIHFDVYEHWSMGTTMGTNILQIAAHEIGHAIGIDHSEYKEAVMHPFYLGYQQNFELHQDDILAAQNLYGKYNTSDGMCADVSIDAITMTEDGHTYAFTGDSYYTMKPDEFAFNYSKPRPLKDWIDTKGPIDAALTLPTGKTILFQGQQYWVFNNQTLVEGPLEVEATHDGLYGRVDAASVFERNGRAYIYKDDVYWRLKNGLRAPEDGFSTSIDAGFFKYVSVWGFSGVKIDAALLWRNKRNYFFSGENYYRYNKYSMKFDDDYPKKISEWWFVCDES